MIPWTLLVQIILIILFTWVLLDGNKRPMLFKAVEKLTTIATSKRFLTLAIATWFVYKNITIDPNWLLFAGFYVGMDTVHNSGLLKAVASKYKTPANKE